MTILENIGITKKEVIKIVNDSPLKTSGVNIHT